MQPISALANTMTIPRPTAAPTTARPAPAPRDARPRLADLEITHPDLAAAIAQVRHWAAAVNLAQRHNAGTADGPPSAAPSLILSGPNGTGKSHIARAILWSMVYTVLDDDGRPIPGMVSPAGRWFAAADLLAQLGHEQDSDGYHHSARPGPLVGSAPFVIIDDVAAELTIPYVAYQAQATERQIRYHLFFDWCIRNGVPVVLTTNLAAAGDESDLAHHVGPRAWSRLMQMCPRGYIISLWSVPDYRRRLGGRQ